VDYIVSEHVNHSTGEEVTCMVKYYICDILSSFLYVNFTVEDVEKIQQKKCGAVTSLTLILII